MRLRNKPWAVKLVNEHPESVLQNPDPDKKIDWAAFRSGAADVGITETRKTQIGYTIPETLPSDLNDEVLKNIHHALLELEVMSGKLVCRHCGREYVIEQGIPNMLLREDEVQFCNG